VVVAICVVLGAASLFQVGEQEANQILMAAGFACSGVTISPCSRWCCAERRRCGCASRPAPRVTVLAVGFDVVPILDVARPAVFGAKVAGAVVATNAIGVWVYRRRGRYRRSS
jgi:hypothetical protein